MGRATIPVDLHNPGQVFACLGFLEAAEILCGPAQGGFDWSGAEECFNLESEGADNPVAVVLEFLAGAIPQAVAPREDLKDKYGIENRLVEGLAPSGELKESDLPVRLVNGDRHLLLEHWADGSTRDKMKFWGGAGGYSGAARTRDLLNLVKAFDAESKRAATNNPFNAAGIVGGGFRLEMRRDYVPIDLGFSANNHGSMKIIGYPLVELMAAIGLQNARAAKISHLVYSYGVWSGLLPLALARAALGGQKIASDLRRFTMTLGKPNDYDRSILFATEESVQ